MIRFLCVVWGVALVFQGVPGMAGDPDEILPIQAVPTVNQQVPAVSQGLEFQGQGSIQRLGQDEVGKQLMVIDDRLFYLSDQIKYYDANGKVASKLVFTPARTVGYFFDAQHKLTALHLTE